VLPVQRGLHFGLPLLVPTRPLLQHAQHPLQLLHRVSETQDLLGCVARAEIVDVVRAHQSGGGTWTTNGRQKHTRVAHAALTIVVVDQLKIFPLLLAQSLYKHTRSVQVTANLPQTCPYIGGKTSTRDVKNSEQSEQQTSSR